MNIEFVGNFGAEFDEFTGFLCVGLVGMATGPRRQWLVFVGGIAVGAGGTVAWVAVGRGPGRFEHQWVTAFLGGGVAPDGAVCGCIAGAIPKARGGGYLSLWLARGWAA